MTFAIQWDTDTYMSHAPANNFLMPVQSDHNTWSNLIAIITWSETGKIKLAYEGSSKTRYEIFLAA